MGKKQHQSDRMFLTAKEWKEEWGGHKDKKHLPYQRLPFNCCAITFTPFEDPVCTADGIVYDVTNIVPYIQKYHSHPVSGEPLEITDLVALQMHKNSDGEYHCPVLGKVFTQVRATGLFNQPALCTVLPSCTMRVAHSELCWNALSGCYCLQHTHIVAVRTSGNVFCWEAIQELNVKTKSWKDLLTEEPFTRKDIIQIQVRRVPGASSTLRQRSPCGTGILCIKPTRLQRSTTCSYIHVVSNNVVSNNVTHRVNSTAALHS